MTLTIVLDAQIPSGKNAIKEHYDGRGKKVRHGNDRFTAWRETAGKEILLQKTKWPLVLKMALPLTGDLIMTVSYRPLDKTQRDIDGMLSALQHLLETMELIEHDGQIKGVTWDYPWRTEGPCVVLELRQP